MAGMVEEAVKLEQKIKNGEIPESQAAAWRDAVRKGLSNQQDATGVTGVVVNQLKENELMKIQPWLNEIKNRERQHMDMTGFTPGELGETTVEMAKTGKLSAQDAITLGYLEHAHAAATLEDCRVILKAFRALIVTHTDKKERMAIFNVSALGSWGGGTVSQHGKNIEALSREGVPLYTKPPNPNLVAAYRAINTQTMRELSEYLETVDGAGPGAEPRFAPSTFAKMKDGFRLAKPASIQGAGTIPLIETQAGWRADTKEVEQALNGQQKEINRLKQKVTSLEKQNTNRNRYQDYNYEDRGGGRGRGRDGDRGRGRGAPWRARGGAEQQEEDAEGKPHTQTRRYFQ